MKKIKSKTVRHIKHLISKCMLKKVVIITSSIVGLFCFSAFMLLYVQDYSGSDETHSSLNVAANVITADYVCSYGEQMFAYIGENNYLYNLDDESTPLIEQSVDMLLYASADSVLYTSPTEYNYDHSGREYNIWELQIGTYENTRNFIASVSITPVWSSNDEVIYFVKDEEPNALYTFEPMTSTVELQCTCEENISFLRVSSDGLLITLQESGLEYLYVPLSKQLTTPYYDCQGDSIYVCEQYDLLLTSEGSLFYHWIGANEAILIAENVIVAESYQDNEIFYVQQADDEITFNIYYVSEEEKNVLARLENAIFPQLVANADYAFFVDKSGIVYRYNISTTELETFTKIDLESVKHPMISVFDYRLMIYDLSREINDTYVCAYEADKQLTEDETTALAVEVHSIPYQEIESASSTLSMASAGEQVSVLQERLSELGYLEGEPTGIYGYETLLAVQYLQSDLGLEENGMVSEELLDIILSIDIENGVERMLVSFESTGIYVRDIQARLAALNYIVEVPNGEIDSVTQSAIKRFAENNLVSLTTVVTEEYIDALYETAIADTDYKTLYYGDSNEQVTILNQKLYDLGYLTGTVLPSYSDKTADALEIFYTVHAIEASSKVCTAEIQCILFSDTAKQCPDDKTPKDILEETPSIEGQVISDRQLKILRNWMTKQFAVNHTDKQAVKRLQKKLMYEGYLTEDSITMVYDQATFDAVMKFQQDNGLTEDGVASKNVLMQLFGTSDAILVYEE